MGVFTRYLIPSLGIKTGFDAPLESKLSHLPYVERLTTAVIFDANINLSGIRGVRVHSLPAESPPTVTGSADGEYTSVDRLTVTQGRMFNPKSRFEAVMNVQAERQGGLHVGSVIEIPFYTDKQVISSAPATARYVKVKLVGVVVASRNVIEGDLSALNASAIIFSPALTRELESNYSNGTETFLKVRGGDRNAKRVLNEIERVDPVAADLPSEVTSRILPVAQQAISPEAVALDVFGAVVGLAALLIGALMIGRTLRIGGGDLATLRALGARRTMLLGDQLFGLAVAIAAGALLSVVVATCLSPLFPLGPVRPIYPHSGLSIDGLVLGLGALAIAVILGLTALVAARRELRQLSHLDWRSTRRHDSRFLRDAVAWLPVSAVAGLRLAFRGGRAREGAFASSALVGAILAVAVLAGTVTFGASLDALVSRPKLYGWNWNVALLSSFAGAEDLPAHQAASLLNRDPDVASWSGANVVNGNIDGEHESLIAQPVRSRVSPPLLSGHGVDAADQIVLGASTLHSLHKRLGDAVQLEIRGAKPRTLTIVGTATMPALSGAGMGDGAVIATSAVPAVALNLQSTTIPGPEAELIRTRPGVSASAARASLERIVKKINAIPAAAGTAGGVVAVLRPAEIVNFHSMGTTPVVLAGVLAAGSLAALGLMLTALVFRRRREMALLKAMGFTQRQLGLAVAWQATTVALVGSVIGIPAGVVIGRDLWLLFAHDISAVPQPVAPVLPLALVAAGALLFANVVAAVPRRIAARTPTALVLRAE